MYFNGFMFFDSGGFPNLIEDHPAWRLPGIGGMWCAGSNTKDGAPEVLRNPKPPKGPCAQNSIYFEVPIEGVL